MQVHKQIKKVKNRKITIDIPENLDGEEVEVVIIPIDKISQKKLKGLLLSGPTLSEKEIEEYEQVSKWIREWRIPQF